MENFVSCPKCGQKIPIYRNPLPTTDIIIVNSGGIVLIRRRNAPFGWAIPGGFIDYGESAEKAAEREALEETSLEINDLRLFGVYSSPERDPRHHTLSVVFTAKSDGIPKAADDALDIGIFSRDNLPSTLAFDHSAILADYFSARDQDRY